MDKLVRFSGLVRKGLRFRRRFEAAKERVREPGFAWYPYDCFANLFYLQHLLHDAGLTLSGAAGTEPVLDIGAGDGALSFFFESLGYRVEAWDNSGTNMNRLEGMRTLAGILGSQVGLRDVDLDGRFEIAGNYGVVLFLGTLYHLKNPFYVLEMLAGHARYCFLSTRIARWDSRREIRLDGLPVAYLLEPDECNADTTNYWIFSPAGLERLARRAGWGICASATSGPADSDPRSRDGDERMFLLLRSTQSPAARTR